MTTLNFDSFGHANTEMFHCESLAELNSETDDGLKVGDVITRGTQRAPTAFDLIDADNIIDGMTDRAWDFCGEAADLGVNVSDEGKAELQTLLQAWFDKHVTASFYQVTNQEQYTITQEDVDALAGAVRHD